MLCAMIVEGGYLHSMKLLIEKAAETPDPVAIPIQRSEAIKPTRVVIQSIKRVSLALIGWES